MKKLLIALLLFSFVAVSCKKNAGAPTAPSNDMIPSTAMLKFSGTMMDGVEGTVTGTANIYLYEGKYLLELKNFSVPNGPDLHVYLSKEINAVNFLDLGKLKSTSGTQIYDISGTPDFLEYKYALIHCQQYNVLFGSAQLK